MAQKVNPIAVRLNFNRFSDSSWFSDYYYSMLLYQDISTRQYFNSIREPKTNKLGVRIGKCIIHHYPKRSLLHVFCLSDFRPEEANLVSKTQNSRKKVKPLHSFQHTKTRPNQSWNFSENPVESNLSKIGKSSSQKENPSVVSWIDSKTIQKKKALIYLSRHIAKSFLQEKFKIWKKKFEKKNSDANAQQLCSKYRNFANEQLEQQSFSLFWSKHEKQTISFLNFYALFYFFLNKMNSTYCERTFPLGINSESKMQNQVRINDALPRQNIRNLLLSWKLALNQVEQNRSIQTEEGEPAIPNTKSTDFYFSNIYGTLSQSFQSSVTLNLIKVKNVYQSASLLAQEIACKLEQKKSFRFICRTIFQQNSSYQYIKGIRITCSGRLNGAEIAKTECKKFGETSLHVFY